MRAMNDDADISRARSVRARFDIPGAVRVVKRFGSGHINDTFAIEMDDRGAPRRYVLQRINARVFQEPAKLMANVGRVVRHLRAKLKESGAPDVHRRVLTLVPARDGTDFVIDDAGECWRVYGFIEGARTFDVMTDPTVAFQAARAFGRFQSLLADLAAPGLHATIPGFHDTRLRLAALEAAISADPCARAAGAAPEIAFARARAPLAGTLLALAEQGLVRERVTHNDTKVNNVLIDDATGDGICILDLDTVMPGIGLYDFGDLARSAIATAAEDEPDAGCVKLDIALFRAVVSGFLAGRDGDVSDAERAHLVTAAKVLTYECGVRFLTDHIEGDAYFGVHRPNQNVDRCRRQFALLREIENRDDELAELVETVARSEPTV